MSLTTTQTFTCDRCKVTQVSTYRQSDKIPQPVPPEGWTSIGRAIHTHICPACWPHVKTMPEIPGYLQWVPNRQPPGTPSVEDTAQIEAMPNVAVLRDNALAKKALVWCEEHHVQVYSGMPNPMRWRFASPVDRDRFVEAGFGTHP
jgi:hypothetical protein